MAQLIESSFAAVIGKQPTAAAQQRLYRLKEALGLRDNDALWSILYALEFYQELYEEMPDQITATTHALLTDVRGSSKAIADAAYAEATLRLTDAVKEATIQVSKDVTAKERAIETRKRLEWLCAAVMVLCMSMLALGFVMFSKGKDAGYAEGSLAGYEAAREKEGQAGFERGRVAGYDAAKSEKAAAAWANTAEGKQAAELSRLGAVPMALELQKLGALGLALELGRAGSLPVLAHCSGNGWKVSEGSCYPYRAPDGQYGWSLHALQGKAP
jgi:hypothetical protein